MPDPDDSNLAPLARDHNRSAWNARVAKKQRFTQPAADEALNNPLTRLDTAWLGSDLSGKRLLCLASGGGRQSALYAAAGAQVTVVDISSEMLALDRQVAAERGFNFRVIETSMDDLSMLEPASFEIVVQPVSTCYVPDVVAVYRQVARVITPGGIYISQHKQPASLQAGITPSAGGYELTEPYYRQGPLPPVVASPHREEGTLEFLHRWEELIGGLCRSGFVVEDLVEPLHAKPDAPPGSFADRSRYVAPYVRIKARRVGGPAGQAGSGKLWTP
jgi:SAM-dependent methyltransferase